MSLQEPSAGKKPPAKKDKITGGVNLKKSIAKKTKPKESESNGEMGLLHPVIMRAIPQLLQVSKQSGRLVVPLQNLLLSMGLVPKRAIAQKAS